VPLRCDLEQLAKAPALGLEQRPRVIELDCPLAKLLLRDVQLVDESSELARDDIAGHSGILGQVIRCALGERGNASRRSVEALVAGLVGSRVFRRVVGRARPHIVTCLHRGPRGTARPRMRSRIPLSTYTAC